MLLGKLVGGNTRDDNNTRGNTKYALKKGDLSKAQKEMLVMMDEGMTVGDNMMLGGTKKLQFGGSVLICLHEGKHE